ncbi:MAG: DUF6265 family protein [Chitinophagaceae bacterium]
MRVFLLVLVFLVSATAHAQLKADIKDLRFLQGVWQTQHEWGDMEEAWSAPEGNSMMGSFRCVKDGKVIFYEFMVIEQKDTVPVLYLRHFSPGSVAWEDKEAPGLYPLTKLEPGKAQFHKSDGRVVLTFRRTAPAQLQIVLESANKEGKWETTEFNYRLKE